MPTRDRRTTVGASATPDAIDRADPTPDTIDRADGTTGTIDRADATPDAIDRADPTTDTIDRADGTTGTIDRTDATADTIDRADATADTIDRADATPGTKDRADATPDPDRIIDAIAARQHGVVARAQILAAGVTGKAVDRRIARGRLRPLYRGVHGAGPVEGRYAREAAAVLACGPSAAVSHASAAAIRRMLPAAASAPVDVLVSRWRRSAAGLRVRCTSDLAEDEVGLVEGIRVTTAARTVLDLAATRRLRTVERALAEGIALRIVTLDDAAAMVARHPSHRGARALQALLDAGDPKRSRSELEERVLALLRRANVRGFEMNVPVAGHKADVWFPKERLVLELDSRAFHSSPTAFERDLGRDSDYAVADLRLMRVTWNQTTKRPHELLVKLGRALGPEPV